MPQACPEGVSSHSGLQGQRFARPAVCKASVCKACGLQGLRLQGLRFARLAVRRPHGLQGLRAVGPWFSSRAGGRPVVFKSCRLQTREIASLAVIVTGKFRAGWPSWLEACSRYTKKKHTPKHTKHNQACFHHRCRAVYLPTGTRNKTTTRKHRSDRFG